ncbi:MULTISPECIES: TatD family hydrolase [unclassified Helicobacter]|uniref:TatD family hydrolase n=1 Tax=unclassified Helicobacter TaxID=2593540 RepID=UPI000CF07F1A|nr:MULTISPECIES: TatD family hydrolase [unclassified Helicobacter]
MFIDTHCHLNDEKFHQDIDKVILNATDANIGKIIIPGADPRELKKAIVLAQKYEHVYFAVGIHPYDLEYGDTQELKKFINHPKCVAVGECGLDYFRLPHDGVEEYKAYQKKRFMEQILLAIEFDKPLILHVREASHDAFEILSKFSQIRGVLHCYNADEILLKLKDNFYYGIGGVCTFTNSKKIINVLPKIPLERLLLETDAPYLTPTPFRGHRNEPAYIPLIAKKIAEILSIPLQDVQSITTQNAQKLFRI